MSDLAERIAERISIWITENLVPMENISLIKPLADIIRATGLDDTRCVYYGQGHTKEDYPEPLPPQWHKAEGNPPPPRDCRKLAWLVDRDGMGWVGIRVYLGVTPDDKGGYW